MDDNGTMEDIDEITALLVAAEKLTGHPNLGNLRKAVLDRLAELDAEWDPNAEEEPVYNNPDPALTAKINARLAAEEKAKADAVTTEGGRRV